MVKLFSALLSFNLMCLAADYDVVEYGRYLANEVAKCGDCHTPRTPTGEIDGKRHLKGAPLDSSACRDIKNPRKESADLTPTGRLFSDWGERGLTRFLETALTPEGRRSGIPMPAYKLRPHDAEAIVAYLKTLQ